MKREEVQNRFSIREEILDLYDRLMKEQKQNYTDKDLAGIGKLLDLKEAGLTEGQMEEYLSETNPSRKRMILAQQRSRSLHHLHRCQKEIDRIDYLCMKIKEEQG